MNPIENRETTQREVIRRVLRTYHGHALTSDKMSMIESDMMQMIRDSDMGWAFGPLDAERNSDSSITIDSLLAEYHRIVWDAALSESSVAYDLVGEDQAIRIQNLFTEKLVALAECEQALRMAHTRLRVATQVRADPKQVEPERAKFRRTAVHIGRLLEKYFGGMR